MYKLVNMQPGDTYPIVINDGVQLFIENEKAFIGELGEVGINAAINVTSRLEE